MLSIFCRILNRSESAAFAWNIFAKGRVAVLLINLTIFLWKNRVPLIDKLYLNFVEFEEKNIIF